MKDWITASHLAELHAENQALFARVKKAEEALYHFRADETDRLTAIGADGCPIVPSLQYASLHLHGLAEKMLQNAAITPMAADGGASAEDLRIALEVSQTFTFVWEPVTDRMRRSESSAAVLGLSPGEAQLDTGERTFQRIHPDDRRRFVTLLENLRPEADRYRTEYRLIRDDGTELIMLESARAFFDAEGRFERLVGTATDIGERQAMPASLVRAKETAEAANVAKSEFLANISHEIRTPMNAILGMAHLIRQHGLTPRQSDQLDKIDLAAQHLTQILNAALDLSRIEAGKFILEETDFDVESLLRNVSHILSHRIAAQGLHLTMKHDNLHCRLRGDPTRLAQALINYANNAIKFTESGTITIRSELLEETADRVLLRFAVADSGIGIAQEHLDRLFTAFEQANSSTGLGLVITKRLAELMGGEVGVTSTPGVGSTFWFTASLQKSAGAAAGRQSLPGESPSTILARDYRGKRILLADDEPINQEIGAELLCAAGLVVEVAGDGAETIEKVRRGQYDIILMDMQMPTMDGLEAARQIRNMPGKESLPILAFTANAFRENRVQCLRAGMNDFLPKPVMPEILYATVLKWLRSRYPAGH